MHQEIYEHAFDPDFGDFDEQGRLKLSSLLHQLSEAAGMACADLGYDRAWMMENNHVYLLSAYRITFSNVCHYGDVHTLQIKTWEEGSKGASVIRNFAVCDDNDRQLALVCSTWLLVDPQSHRILRPSDFKGKVPRVQPQAYRPLLPEKLHAEAVKERLFRKVRYSDLDMNRHIYNARYADIIYDALPACCRQKQLKEFQIQYKKEAKFGDRLSIGVSEHEGEITVCGLLADDTVSFLAKLSFVSAESQSKQEKTQ